MTSLLLWYESTKLKIILAMPFKSDEIRKEMLDVLTGYFKPSRANDHQVHRVRHLLKSQKPYR